MDTVLNLEMRPWESKRKRIADSSHHATSGFHQQLGDIDGQGSERSPLPEQTLQTSSSAPQIGLNTQSPETYPVEGVPESSQTPIQLLNEDVVDHCPLTGNSTINHYHGSVIYVQRVDNAIFGENYGVVHQQTRSDDHAFVLLPGVPQNQIAKAVTIKDKLNALVRTTGNRTGLVPGKVTANNVRYRRGPRTSCEAIGHYHADRSITIICMVEGECIKGWKWWDKLSNGFYISDYYVEWTGGVPCIR